ncbi:MAG: OmpH family outer membrane protein [Sneathiella sp.]|nr:OmpH family outer membrane protein [Sneathiella sp.]
MAFSEQKSVYSSLWIALFVAFSLVIPASAVKAEIVVILDLGKVLANSKAMTDINRQIKILETEIRAVGIEREKQLRDEQDELNRQRVILPPETFEQKKKAFNKKAKLFKNEMQSKLRQLALSRSVSINKIEKTMEPIVSKIAASVGATLILEKKQILFGAKNLDISSRIIKQLNAVLTTVPVKLVPLPKK